ncbi:hypothetical protein [Bacillus sp. 1P06AnD]
MEKKYCVHCRRLINDECVCGGCGNNQFKDIVISVQAQGNKLKQHHDL